MLTIIDIQFDPYGHLLATTSKDGKVRVLDVRAQTTIAVMEVKECLRDTQVIWISRNLLLVIGTGKGLAVVFLCGTSPHRPV